MGQRFWMAAATLSVVVVFAAAAGAVEPPTDAAKAKAEAEARQRDAEARKEAAKQEAQKRAAEIQAFHAELLNIVVTDLDPAGDGPPPQGGDQKAIQIWHRKQSIRNMARSIEMQGMVSFRGELELIRRTCGSLGPETRRRALEAGMLALRKAALDMANAQAAGRQPTGTPASDTGFEAALKVIAEAAAPEELAAYHAERKDRSERRRRRARTLIVAAVDSELDLSAAQRIEIDAALDKAWQEGWGTAAGIFGMQHPQLAPDFAADCIVPSLTPRQRAAWTTWCGQRSAKHVVSQNPQFGRAGLMHSWQSIMGTAGLPADDWWGAE